MGVSARKLVYDFDRKYDSILSGKNKEIALFDKIAYLNEAQELWFENRVELAQTDKKIRNDLRVFKKDKKVLSCSELDEECCKAVYPSNFYSRLNEVVIAGKDCCPNSKKIIPRIIQSDDQYEALLNPYRKPDFYFEQLLAVESTNGLIVFHAGEMDILKVVIDYYRKPNEIHAPSLEKCDGPYYYDYKGRVINQDSDFEVDNTFAANIVTDIAVLCAARDIGNIQNFQTQLNKIFTKQQL